MRQENISLFFKGGSTEDYLAMVRDVCEECGGVAQQAEVAARMGFSKPSITRAMRVLEQKKLVWRERDGGNQYAHLTETGRALAERLRRRRRSTAAFLEDLGLSAADALAEAHLWEHGISDETAAAMDAALRARAPAGAARARPRAKDPDRAERPPANAPGKESPPGKVR
ncbi:MAG: hypothetical protein LBD95_00305 [Clostridiales Family XIII bacterium]|nr:hypothetical protein [Clostridiales Family XIII bacterium]